MWTKWGKSLVQIEKKNQEEDLVEAGELLEALGHGVIPKRRRGEVHPFPTSVLTHRPKQPQGLLLETNRPGANDKLLSFLPRIVILHSGKTTGFPKNTGCTQISKMDK